MKRKNDEKRQLTLFGYAVVGFLIATLVQFVVGVSNLYLRIPIGLQCMWGIMSIASFFTNLYLLWMIMVGEIEEDEDYRALNIGLPAWVIGMLFSIIWVMIWTAAMEIKDRTGSLDTLRIFKTEKKDD